MKADMMKRVVLCSLGLLMMAGGGRAQAGVADTPVPVIMTGKATLNLYQVPGVAKFANVETDFVCTPLEKTGTSLRIAIEVFGPSGSAPLNDVTAGDGVMDLTSGQTVMIGTGDVAGFSADATIWERTSVRVGSARVLSASSKVICGAFYTDRLSTTPTTMGALTVIKKLKQSGD